MKTKLLYHENSYIYECSATVVDVEGDEVALDATIFFPGGGGQVPEHGIISWNNRQNEGAGIAMNQREEQVWHTPDCLPPPRGTETLGTIDSRWRTGMRRSVP